MVSGSPLPPFPHLPLLSPPPLLLSSPPPSSQGRVAKLPYWEVGREGVVISLLPPFFRLIIFLKIKSSMYNRQFAPPSASTGPYFHSSGPNYKPSSTQSSKSHHHISIERQAQPSHERSSQHDSRQTHERSHPPPPHHGDRDRLQQERMFQHERLERERMQQERMQDKSSRVCSNPPKSSFSLPSIPLSFPLPLFPFCICTSLLSSFPLPALPSLPSLPYLTVFVAIMVIHFMFNIL